MTLPLGHGVGMRLYFDSVLSELIYYWDFEGSERLFLGGYLKPGDTFVDVGANVGLFTLLASRLVGASGRVLAFEPSERSFERLVENVRLNGFTNVLCERLALSDAACELDLQASHEGRDAWNSLAPAAEEGASPERVTCVVWDDYSRAHGLLGRVAMMKIDVEGWERRVLAGGRDALGREDGPLLQVEFSDAAAKASGTSCRELYEDLRGHGYRMYRFDAARGLVPEPCQDAYDYVNLFALKARHLR